LVFAAAAGVALAACGGGGHKATTSTSVPSTSASAGSATTSGSSDIAVFCQQLATFANDSSSAGSDTALAQARTDYTKVVADADAITNPPAAISSAMRSAIDDVHAVNTWVQTQATEAELNGSSVPGAVAKPFNDLQTQGKTIETYAKAHCTGFP
jgi:hypothetical protein